MIPKQIPFIPLLLVGIVLLMVVAPVSGERHIVWVEETHLNLTDLQNEGITEIGWWSDVRNVHSSPPIKTISLVGRYEDFVVSRNEVYGYIPFVGSWYSVDSSTGFGLTPSILEIRDHNPPTQAPTPTPTPTPTPATGSIIIQSTPDGAMVFVDNVVKGITPITVAVPNGDHTVRLRLDGYEESVSSVTVTGDEKTVDEDLVLIAIIQEEQTGGIEVTTEPTAVPIDYSATIAILQTQVEQQATQIVEQSSQIEQQATQIEQHSEQINVQATEIKEQATKNAEQDAAINQQAEDIGILQSIINSILAFLGLN